MQKTKSVRKQGNYKLSNKRNGNELVSLDHNLIMEKLSKPESSKKIVGGIIRSTGLPVNFLAEKVFDVTPKTLGKYKTSNIKLPLLLLELAVKFRVMHSLGTELFDTRENFNRWLGEKNIGLNFQKPADLLNTSVGIELIFEELKRIEYGATA